MDLKNNELGYNKLNNNQSCDNSEIKENIEEINSQLEQKINKTDLDSKIWSMSNMGQDVKEAMTGGSVPVVGDNTILESNIVDGQVTPIKTTFFTKSKNLFNVNAITENYLFASSGNPYASSAWDLTDYIYVSEEGLSEETKFTISINTSQSFMHIMCMYYDSSKTKINTKPVEFSKSGSNYITFTVPVGTCYFRLAIKKPYANDNLMIEQGDTKTFYVPYMEISNDVITTFKKNIESEINNVDENLNSYKNNLKLVNSAFVYTAISGSNPTDNYFEENYTTNSSIYFKLGNNKSLMIRGTITKTYTMENITNLFTDCLTTSPNGISGCIELKSLYILVYDIEISNLNIIKRDNYDSNKHILILSCSHGRIDYSELMNEINTMKFNDLEDKIGNNEIQLPTYIEEEIDNIINKLRDIQSRNSISFGFITDIHNSYALLKKCLLSINKINNKKKIDFLCFGGDYITNNSSTTFENANNQLENFRECVEKYNSIDNISLLGNHDDNSMGIYDNIILPDIYCQSLWNYSHKHLDNVGDNMYGYRDDKVNKIRYIFINPLEVPYIKEDNGTPRYRSQWAYMVSNEQIQWFAKCLEFTEDDWNTVVLSHIPLDSRISNDYVKNGDVILDLIKARKNKTSYTKNELRTLSFYDGTDGSYTDYDIQINVSANYSNQPNFNFICCIHGHLHKDTLKTIDDIVHIGTINCGNDSNKTPNTLNETAYDIFVINTKLKKCNVIRYGYGSDREFLY